MQLELSLWSPTCLRSIITDYLARQAEHIADGTLVDYQERARWLLRELGEATEASELTFVALERLADRCRGLLRNVTISKRLNFLRWCLAYAKDRELVASVPRCPRLRNDAQVRTGRHTLEQWRLFRAHVPPGRFRKLYDLGFLTGQHMPDMMSMQRWMLDPDCATFPGYRGAFWRRNRKYRRCVPCWMPMQPEMRLLVFELLEDVGPAPDAVIVGRTWNMKRTWDMAADRAAAAGQDVPRVTPTDLRRSASSLLAERGWSLQAIRIFLGHATDDGRVMGGAGERRPSVAERHYLWPTPGLFVPRAPTTP